MQWNIDPAHSSIEFAVRHLGIATVRGRFRMFEGQAVTGPDDQLISLTVRIESSSLDTGFGPRDKHLRAAEFFDVAQHPEIVFVSTAIQRSTNGETRVVGDLTMHGLTRPVSFTVKQSQAIQDPWGGRRIGGSASGALSRKEWGLTWSQMVELGGIVVSDEVKFNIDVQVVAAQAVAA